MLFAAVRLHGGAGQGLAEAPSRIHRGRLEAFDRLDDHLRVRPHQANTSLERRFPQASDSSLAALIADIPNLDAPSQRTLQGAFAMCLPNDVPAAPRQSILGPGGPGNRRSGLAAWTSRGRARGDRTHPGGPDLRARRHGRHRPGWERPADVGGRRGIQTSRRPESRRRSRRSTSPPTPDYRRSGVRAA